MRAIKPHRPALRYYGGKWRLAPWILSFAPPHACYCEPFSGGASILLRKDRAPAETINDLDGEIQAFFRVLRDRGPELIEKIRLTPFSRREWEESKDRSGCDELEAARRVYIRSWQSMHGGLRPNKTGWRQCRGTSRLTSAADEFADVSALPLIVDRLRGVQIESDEASNVIRRYDSSETLFVVDPPYPKASRSAKWGKDGYVHEMTTEDHAALLKQLLGVRGMVLLCSYQTDQYDAALPPAGWKLYQVEANCFAGAKAVESLYVNPLAEERRSRQTTIWSAKS